MERFILKNYVRKNTIFILKGIVFFGVKCEWIFFEKVDGGYLEFYILVWKLFYEVFIVIE